MASTGRRARVTSCRGRSRAAHGGAAWRWSDSRASRQATRLLLLRTYLAGKFESSAVAVERRNECLEPGKIRVHAGQVSGNRQGIAPN